MEVALKNILQCFVAFTVLWLGSSWAVADGHADIEKLRQEIESLKKIYEDRISELESKISNVESEPKARSSTGHSHSHAPATATRSVKDNSSNPSIGMVLNGLLMQEMVMRDLLMFLIIRAHHLDLDKVEMLFNQLLCVLF